MASLVVPMAFKPVALFTLPGEVNDAACLADRSDLAAVTARHLTRWVGSLAAHHADHLRALDILVCGH